MQRDVRSSTTSAVVRSSQKPHKNQTTTGRNVSHSPMRRVLILSFGIIVLICVFSIWTMSLDLKMISRSNESSTTTITSTIVKVPSNFEVHTANDYISMTSKTTPPFEVNVYKKGDIVSNNIIKNGTWDAGISFVMTKILESKPGVHTIVDFGTHIGWFSLLAASKGHRSIGIEAMRSNREAFMASVIANNFASKITLHAAALGDLSSPSSLCIGARTPGANIGNGQTTAASSECTESIDVHQLDDFFGTEDILFMKADCEGCEAGAILGATKMLGKNPPCSIFVEWRPDGMRQVGGNPRAAGSLLLESGYMLYRLQAHLTTGAGLTISNLLESLAQGNTDAAGFLDSNGSDLLFLHDSRRCFPKSSAVLHNLLDSINAAGKLYNGDEPLPL